MSTLNIVCLDLEGVLVPEIWIAFAEASGIPELKRTTRDEPDYDKLMAYRIAILKEHGLGLKEIQETIAKIDPMPGAKEFLDELRSMMGEGESWLVKIEQQEREATGIKNLKIGYNRVFGYYLEVTNSFRNLVPDYYIRKQTLANAERYITPELKELEDIILGAEKIIVQMCNTRLLINNNTK